MLSFRSFITEAKLVHDARSEVDKPFGVSFAGLHGDMSAHAKPRFMQFHDADKHPVGAVANINPYFHRGGLIVHPITKTIHDNQDVVNDTADRRYNQKIGPYAGRSAKNSTPVIAVEQPSIPHHIARSLAAHIDPDEYHYNGKPLRHYMTPEKTPHQKWAEGRESITVYHGTSAKRARDILSTGLKPGQRPEDEHYSDLVPNYSEHNVYLSPHPDEAANYATRQAIHDRSKPVILKTTIHPKDYHKLRPDEDSMHWWGNTVSKNAKREFYGKHPEWKDTLESQGIHYRNLAANSGKLPWSDSFVHEKKPVGVHIDDYHKTVLASLEHAFTSRPALKPTGRLSSGFAYKGEIPAHKISHHAAWEMHSTSGDPGPIEYEEAYKKMKASLKIA